jgi:hypothetical protein
MRLATLFALVVVTPATADVYFSEGAWVVEVEQIDATGELYCAASTTTGATQFSLIATKSAIDAVVLNQNWQLGERDISGAAIIGEVRYSFDAVASGVGVVVSDLTPEFLNHLQSGTTITFLNERGAKVAAFDLNGSRNALRHLDECTDRLPAAPTDPFAPQTNAANPFGETF